MMNKDFLKTLRILFVEDEELARNQLAKVLNRLFKEVVIAKNGLEGFQAYQENKLNETPVDLILSDINMPQMNGIEMLEKIREHDTTTPLIFTTARTETQYLIKAIELGVVQYAIKPVDIEDIVSKIEKVCEKRYFEALIEEKNNRLNEYLKIIDSVATIYKMNKEGKIIFANELFLETCGLKEEEVLAHDITEVLSPEMDKNLIAKIWETILNDGEYKGDLKYINKQGENFFIKSTIFKITTENSEEFINIGFDSTSDIKEKREFHKKLIQSIKDKNLQATQTQDNSKKYELLISRLNEELSKEKERTKAFARQVEHYEDRILNSDDKIVKNLKIKNTEIEDLKNLIEKLKNQTKTQGSHIDRLNNELNDTKNELEELYEKLERKEKRVENLLDIVEDREALLKKYDSSFEF